MDLLPRFTLAACLLALSACASLSPAQRERSAQVVAAARPVAVDCDRLDRCAQPSPLRDLAARALAESTPEQPRHYAIILDHGTDALRARINLIRAATTRIDLQTYIFDEDDAGQLVLDELLMAARRGVKVRLLLDQLSALRRVDTLAALAGAHANLEVRIYNPVLDRARINYPQYAIAAACCWRKLNQRMHSKMLLVDGAVGITGGRNYQDDYYDWDREFNFRDRDLLVAGPVAATMDTAFVTFWNDTRTKPVEYLRDVGKRLIDGGVPVLPAPVFEQPERAQAMRRDAADAALIGERVAALAIAVGEVHFVSDTPMKQRSKGRDREWTSDTLRELIEGARSEVLLQTPYLVMSKPAQAMFRRMHARERTQRPRVMVSTNSLASTDAFIAYALSYKYKRRYLREFGFDIFEYKPFPQDAPVDVAATGAGTPGTPEAAGSPPAHPGHGPSEALARPGPGFGSAHAAPGYMHDRRSVIYRPYSAPLSREYAAKRYSRRRANEPVPLERAGPRLGLHAKSLVIDERIGVIGTHNFDPRGDNYNTESAVVIEDEAFAHALAASIRRDTAPENAWVIAPRKKPPVFSGLDYSIGKLSEQLPIFDLWPTRYATSYEFVPGPACPEPLPRGNPGFSACYRAVGDFPEVNLGLKSVMTRIFTAFGAGLAPIL
ncbi:phospholipase D family protein [Lysobacter solisilvae (ex Woo and Kim 2020)]|uniref:Phospholipase D family protein n=1 Tax=Agrilutibacter terrestris TaxID=2865112 RepID=A0A7H0FTR3_9GAMM|nr:phospholipase D family protein [Lysobacter terrestris]QNP39429.1 phospholipase D family protein [Lysobacter terrestris]